MTNDNPYKAPATKNEETIDGVDPREFTRTIWFLNFLSWLVPFGIVVAVTYLLYSAVVAAVMLFFAAVVSAFMSMPARTQRRRARNATKRNVTQW